MGTFHLEISDFNVDPSDAIASLVRQDEKAGHLAGHAYGMARAFAQQLGCDRAVVSGGWLPLPDGTDSISINIGMHTGASDLSYRDRVMHYLTKGPGYGEGHTELSQPAGSTGERGGDGDGHPGAVLGVGGAAGEGGPDHGTAGGVDDHPDEAQRPELGTDPQ